MTPPADPPSLWDQAYEALGKEKPEVVQAYEELLYKVLPRLENASATADLNEVLSKPPDNPAGKTYDPNTTQSIAGRRKLMADVIDQGRQHMEGKQLALKIGQQKFVLRDQMQYVVAGVQLGKEWIDGAVKSSPTASVAWAGVCLLIPLLTNPAAVQQVNEQGLAYIAQKIQFYTAMESFTLHVEDDKVYPQAVRRDYQDRLIDLYQAVIDFQAQSVLRFFRGRFKNLLRETVKWDPWEEMLQKVKELARTIESQSLQISAASSRNALSLLVQRSTESEEDKCLQSLWRGQYEVYKDLVQQRVSDTCLWFLGHHSYHSWLTAKSGPLLVSADPGCGKSVLAKYLIDSRFDFKLPRETAICYFFFKDEEQNTIELALCALLHQLLCQRPQLMQHVLPKYKQTGEGLAKNPTALWSLLESATADSEAGAVVIVLDALDECLQNERNMGTLSRYIHSHFDTGPRHMKILMTSRPYQGTIQHISRLEQAFPSIRIKGEDESVTIREEINSVIEYRVDRMTEFNINLKDHLKRRLIGITHRTYLWLYLVFDHLERGTFKSTCRGLDEAIDRLPATVNEAYERILSRSVNPEKTRRAILILLGAYEPLTLRQMQIAFESTIDTNFSEEFDLESDNEFGKHLREWCGLFITVHDFKIYFLHQTVREFLLPCAGFNVSPTAAAAWAHSFTINQAHAIMAESCVTFLSRLNHRADADMELKFSLYFVDYWGDHFREADDTDVATLIPLVLHICNPDSKSYSQWSYLRQDMLSEERTKLTNLMIASYLGHKAIVKILLESGKVDVDSKDQWGQTPLSWAAESGFETVVKLLLETGKVDVDSKDQWGQTPLSWAAESGFDTVVKFLLETGKVDVDSKDRWGQTPLSWAVEGGHGGIVRLLREYSATTKDVLEAQ